jgi:O-antigen ligase
METVAAPGLRWPAAAARSTPAEAAVPLLFTLILSGAMPFMSHYLRASTWLVWAAMALVMSLLWRPLDLGRLLLPMRPYLLWLGFYMIWGLIIADYRDFGFAVKVSVTTVLLGGCAAVIGASPRNLGRFATGVQIAVIGNLAILFLANLVPRVALVIQTVTFRAASFEEGMSRYGGLWGNPNLAGFVCIVATLLSVFAAPWAARLGRLSCLPLLYLSASRKSAILYLAILVLYLLLVQRRNVKFWAGSVSLALALGMAFTLSTSLRRQSAAVEQNPYVSRLLDLTESSKKRTTNDETRVELFREWSRVLAAEPWYGYGLETMAGTLISEDTLNTVRNKGILPLGSHNTYLGVWIETGPIGFLAFLAVIVMYLRTCLKVRGPARLRWAMASLALVNAVFLFFSHSHLFESATQIVCALMFLLPTSPAVRELADRADRQVA